MLHCDVLYVRLGCSKEAGGGAGRATQGDIVIRGTPFLNLRLKGLKQTPYRSLSLSLRDQGFVEVVSLSPLKSQISNS